MFERAVPRDVASIEGAPRARQRIVWDTTRGGPTANAGLFVHYGSADGEGRRGSARRIITGTTAGLETQLGGIHLPLASVSLFGILAGVQRRDTAM